MNPVLLIIFGIIVGGYGTIIGAGGGFALVPLLLILYPKENPAIITAVSLTVIFFNALSGTIAYIKMKRVDIRSALIFSAATLPGAIFGVYAVRFIGRRIFDFVFAVLLIVLSVFLTAKSNFENENNFCAAGGSKRVLLDADNKKYEYGVNEFLGAALSVFVGFFSSVLGIGGGIIHVPAFVYLLKMPCHISTASSHFILAVMTFAAALYHFYLGDLQGKYLLILYLSIGMIIGAQAGAKFSNRFSGSIIIKLLAGALILVALRLLFL